jgi:hypothetical protein
MRMKLLSHLMKLLHLMTLTSQQFCLYNTLFNIHDTLMKHIFRLTLTHKSDSVIVHVLRLLYRKSLKSLKAGIGVTVIFIRSTIFFSDTKEIVSLTFRLFLVVVLQEVKVER